MIIPGIIIYAVLLKNKLSENDMYKGIYVQLPESIMEVGYKPIVKVDNEIYFELHRFKEMMLNSNITAFEMLFAKDDDVIIRHSSLASLKECNNSYINKRLVNNIIERINFLSKKINKQVELNSSMLFKKTRLNFCKYIENQTGTLWVLSEYLNYANQMSNAARRPNLSLHKISSLKNVFMLSDSWDKAHESLIDHHGNLNLKKELDKQFYEGVVLFDEKLHTEYKVKTKLIKKQKNDKSINIIKIKSGELVNTKILAEMERLSLILRMITSYGKIHHKILNSDARKRAFKNTIEGRIDLLEVNKIILSRINSSKHSISRKRMKFKEKLPSAKFRNLIKQIRKDVYNESSNNK